MKRDERPSWTDAEPAGLLARYFGEKLSTPQPKRLIGQAAVLTGRPPSPRPAAGEASAGHQNEGEALSCVLPVALRLQRATPAIGLLSSALMLFFGLTMATGNYHLVSGWLYQHLPLA